jgi:hypothetical protein
MSNNNHWEEPPYKPTAILIDYDKWEALKKELTELRAAVAGQTLDPPAKSVVDNSQGWGGDIGDGFRY